MEWKDLSIEAKSVIEWVENPYNGKREKITIMVGDIFSPMSGVKITITPNLYKEIKNFVEQDDSMETYITDVSMSFWLR